MRWMSLCFALSLFVTGCGQKTAEEYNQEIQAKNEQMEAALLKKDPFAFSTFWAKDGVYINITTHQTLKGPDQIKEYFARLFQNAVYSKMTVENIEFIDDRTASEVGKFTLSYQGKPLETHTFKAIFVHQDGNWLLQKVIEAEFLEPATHYKDLKELDWLVGYWIDEEPNMEVYYEYKWDDNKNFLIQDFQMDVLDEEELKGQQIIGWDPAAKEIRSWIFDSDGGIGEGHWSKKGNTWYVTVSFILSDGRKATALHLYTQVDKDTYMFTSQDRDIDGALLPDIGPIKIVRRK